MKLRNNKLACFDPLNLSTSSKFHNILSPLRTKYFALCEYQTSLGKFWTQSEKLELVVNVGEGQNTLAYCSKVSDKPEKKFYDFDN